MQTPSLHFSRAEYADRLRKTRTAMQAAGIDTLIVYTRPPGSAVWERTTCLTDPAGEGLGAPQAAMWLGADGVPALAVKLRGRVAVGVFLWFLGLRLA